METTGETTIDVASADEALAQTCAREVAEESGLDRPASDFRELNLVHRYAIYSHWLHRYAPEVTHNTEHVFSACVPRDTAIVLSPREHTRYAWLPYREAADRCFSASNAEAILQLPRQV